MPINLSVYPHDFNLSRIGSSSIDPVDAGMKAISTVETNARDTAIRQAQARRMTGQAIIANQAQFIRSSSRLMPLSLIGKPLPSSIPFSGTEACTGGWEGHAQRSTQSLNIFAFSNRKCVDLGMKLSEPRLYCATVGDAESGKFIGGYTSNNLWISHSIDKINYIKKTVNRVAAKIDRGSVFLTGGLGDSVKGIAIGGSSNFSDVSENLCHFYQHATDNLTTYNNALGQPKISVHGGLSSKVAGFVWAGAERPLHNYTKKILIIDQVDYSSGLNRPTISALSVIPPEAHQYHAALSSLAKGYILEGVSDWDSSLPNGSSRATAKTTGFRYSGNVLSVLASSLSVPSACITGAGCSAFGNTFGGYPGNYYGSKRIEELDYTTEKIMLLDEKLSVEYADQGSVSDYSPGFSR